MAMVFAPHNPPVAPVVGGDEFAVRRIFCVGRNYGAHVAEMGGDARKDSPVFFTKPADALVTSGAAIPYPPETSDLHFEGELVVALRRGGVRLSEEESAASVFGYAAGCDLTRRDLQQAAKKSNGPWDMAKGFDHSAPIGKIAPGDIKRDARLVTLINGDVRQSAPLSDMIWSVPELIARLSNFVELKSGDLIFTGTPSGVGPVAKGETVEVRIDGLPTLAFSVKG